MSTPNLKEKLGFLLNSFVDIEQEYYFLIKKHLLSTEGLKIKVLDSSFEWIKEYDTEDKRFKFETPLRCEMNQLILFSDETFEVSYPYGKLTIYKNPLKAFENLTIVKGKFINIKLNLSYERSFSEAKSYLTLSPQEYLKELLKLYKKSSLSGLESNEIVLIRTHLHSQELNIKQNNKYHQRIKRQYLLLKNKGYILGY